MLSALVRVEGGEQVLPNVKLFCDAPSHYWWEDEVGVHEVDQGEGSEQGDAMVPLLFAWGQHDSLTEVENELRPEELLFAFLEDRFVVSRPERVGVVDTFWENALWRHARDQLHAGKTKVWNRAGVRPAACDVLEREHTLRWKGRECGEGNREERTWHQNLGSLSDIRSSRIICRRSVNTSKPSWTEFPPSLTCSQRGLCCCIAQQQEPINSSGLCRLTAHTRSRWPMMTRCGDVSVLCCGSRRTCARLPRCHSPSVALAPQCRPHCYSGFLGQLG